MTTEVLEFHLSNDLASLGDRLADEEFCFDLYRALAGNALHPARAGLTGRLSLSWRRAEDLVNDLRDCVGRRPLTLAQTGGEGEVSNTVADELAGLGWTLRPRKTSVYDEAHTGAAPHQPPGDQGERFAPGAA